MNKYNYNFNNKNFIYYLRDDVDFSVFNEVFKLMEYKSSIEKIKSSIYPIIDVGAHVGFFSIFATSINSSVKIYSIEPEKNNFELLNKHKDENRFENINTFKMAIAGKSYNGELILSEDSINHKIKREVINTKKKKIEDDNFQKVRVFSLKDFFIENKLDRVSLIKMDIEGGEYDIFDHLDVDDFSRIESFVIEYHEDKNSKKDRKYLENILRENGFSVQIFPSRFDEDLGFIFALNKR